MKLAVVIFLCLAAWWYSRTCTRINLEREDTIWREWERKYKSRLRIHNPNLSRTELAAMAEEARDFYEYGLEPEEAAEIDSERRFV